MVFIKENKALAVMLVTAVIACAQSEGDSFTDSRDGKEYRSVKIGSQTWMAENLSYETKNSWCYDNSNGCSTYGRHYAWDAAMNACPAGWRLPNNEDWNGLALLAGGGSVASRILKSKSGWKGNGNGTDEFGFGALPGGGYLGGSFNDVGESGAWWSATEQRKEAFRWRIDFGWHLEGDVRDKSRGMSVRCVRGGANTSSSANQKKQSISDLAGVWKGSYFLYQNEIGLTLTVYKEDANYKATFEFYNLPGKTNTERGKFYMKVSYNQSAKTYYLEGYEWIEDPWGYEFIDLEGTITGNTFSGSKYNFRVRKQ